MPGTPTPRDVSTTIAMSYLQESHGHLFNEFLCGVARPLWFLILKVSEFINHYKRRTLYKIERRTTRSRTSSWSAGWRTGQIFENLSWGKSSRQDLKTTPSTSEVPDPEHPENLVSTWGTAQQDVEKVQSIAGTGNQPTRKKFDNIQDQLK